MLDHGDKGDGPCGARRERTSTKWPHHKWDVGGQSVREAKSTRLGQQMQQKASVRTLVAQRSDPSSVHLAVCSGAGASSTENLGLLF